MASPWWRSAQNTAEMVSTQTRTIRWLHFLHTIVWIPSKDSLCSIQRHPRQSSVSTKLSCHDTREALLAWLERNIHPCRCCRAVPMVHRGNLTTLPRMQGHLDTERSTVRSWHLHSIPVATPEKDRSIETGARFQR